jgi:gliding motility-associated-like protein
VNAPPIALAGFSPPGGTWTGNGIAPAGSANFHPAIAGVANHTLTYTFTDTNGCTNADQRIFIVHPKPILNLFHDSILCVNVAQQFINLSTGAFQYQWNFGDGNTSTAVNPIHPYTNPGIYNITLIGNSTTQCFDTISSTLRVITPPQALFSIQNNNGCAPHTTNFNNLSTGYQNQALWYFFPGSTQTTNQPNQVTFPGAINNDTTYLVTLTSTNLCGTSTFTDSVHVRVSTVANFTPTPPIGCHPLTVAFQQNATGNPNAYSWNFGNGNASAAPNPSPVLYTNTGTVDSVYWVSLTVTNPCGPNTLTLPITVKPNTINAFFNTSPPSGCAPLTVQFTNFSNNPTVTDWTFGDGNVSNAFSPSHTFTQGGNYTVQLVANDGCAFDTANFNITVYPQPNLNIQVAQDSLCAGVPFNFSTNPGLANTIWTFGDASGSLLYNPAHAYAQGGTYNVTLIGATPAYNCTDTLSVPVFVRPKPQTQIQLSDSIGCAPFSVQFTDPLQQAIFHAWDFADGQNGTGATTNHDFLQTGQFIVSLIGSNQWGCADTSTANVWVYDNAVADFVPPAMPICQTPANFTLTNLSTGAIGYQWNLGNNTNSTQFQPNVTYTQPGTYTIELIATNQYTCADTIAYDFTIDPEVQANFNIIPDTIGCAPFKIDVINLTSGADQFIWNFGNGSTSNQENPVVFYTNPGSYTIELIASNAYGCVDTLRLQDIITVLPTPTAQFLVTPDLINSLTSHVDLLDLSIGATSGFYLMGDGNQIPYTNNFYNYTNSDTGWVTIYQIVSNDFGCTDTATANIRRIPQTTFYLPTAFSPNEDGKNEVFKPEGLLIREFHMDIYNRWGDLVFTSNDVNYGWDGTIMNSGGAICKSDVYVVKITYRDIEGVKHRVYSRVTLTSSEFFVE